MTVASQYGIHSLRQTVGTVKFIVMFSLLHVRLLRALIKINQSVKFAVWKFFYRDCSYLDCAYFVLMLYCTLVCVCVCYVVLCLHFVAIFWCNK